MTSTLRVTHVDGDRFESAIRQHRIFVDQPIAEGGTDSAPTPTELFVASLASCVGFYACRFLARHGLPTDGLSVEARYSLTARPARIGEVIIELRVPDDVPDDKRGALLAVATHCTVHNTLENPPKVRIDLASPQDAAA
jgi:putative redox protein